MEEYMTKIQSYSISLMEQHSLVSHYFYES